VIAVWDGDFVGKLRFV